jgi:hypothetical protein
MSGNEPRLVIAQRPTRRDHLHGAWWPRSSDINHELVPMLNQVTVRFGAVLGIMLNRDEWPDAAVIGPHARVGTTKISWYGLAESHQAVLFCNQSRRISLLLLAPDTPEKVALTATLMACAPGNALTTEETLVRAQIDASVSPPGGAPQPYVNASARRPRSGGGVHHQP